MEGLLMDLVKLEADIREAFSRPDVVPSLLAWGRMAGDLRECCGMGTTVLDLPCEQYGGLDLREVAFARGQERYGMDETAVRQFMVGWDCANVTWPDQWTTPARALGVKLSREFVKPPEKKPRQAQPSSAA